MYTTYNDIFNSDGHIKPEVDSNVLCGIARNPNTPIEILIDIWANRTDEKVDSVVLCELALNTSTPIATLREIWANRADVKVNSDVLYSLVRNRGTPASVLEEIWINRDDEKINFYVLWEVSANPKTPPTTLQNILANIADLKVDSGAIINLALNPNTPIETLKAIWANRDDEKVDSYVLGNLAQNPLLPYSVAFEMLSEGNNPSVLNPDSPLFNAQLFITLGQNYEIGTENKNKPISNKNGLITDFLKANCQNIKHELDVFDRRRLLNTLKSMSEEQLFVAFDVLKQIDIEESRKLTTSKVLDRNKLTYDGINDRMTKAIKEVDAREIVDTSKESQAISKMDVIKNSTTVSIAEEGFKAAAAPTPRTERNSNVAQESTSSSIRATMESSIAPVCISPVKAEKPEIHSEVTLGNSALGNAASKESSSTTFLANKISGRSYGESEASI